MAIVILNIITWNKIDGVPTKLLTQPEGVLIMSPINEFLANLKKKRKPLKIFNFDYHNKSSAQDKRRGRFANSSFKLPLCTLPWHTSILAKTELQNALDLFSYSCIIVAILGVSKNVDLF